MSIPQIRLSTSPWFPGVEVLISHVDKNRLFVAEELRYREIDEDLIPGPQLKISHTDAQSLMDQLWQCGFRPTEGAGSAGALAAVKAHLDDFRRLVFEDERFKPQLAKAPEVSVSPMVRKVDNAKGMA